MLPQRFAPVKATAAPPRLENALVLLPAMWYE
jgi:hypothetical protein